jgi:choline-glycine betaine transporter
MGFRELKTMADIFTAVIQKLQQIGAFNFLFPYILTSAIFYGLLRKSQIFGKSEDNVAVNGIVAIVAALMVLAYPILSGVSMEGLLPPFFAQGLVVTLVFMIALMIMGMFLPPDLPDVLSKNLLKGNKMGAMLIVGIFFGFLILFLSGLGNVLLGPHVIATIPEDVMTLIAIILLIIVPILLIVWGGGEKTTTPAPTPEKNNKRE